MWVRLGREQIAGDIFNDLFAFTLFYRGVCKLLIGPSGEESQYQAWSNFSASLYLPFLCPRFNILFYQVTLHKLLPGLASVSSICW